MAGTKEFVGLLDWFRSRKPQLTEAQQKWNKMWALWAEEEAQAPYAQLMTYQSELENGGHDQYFFNVGNTHDLKKEMAVLETVLPGKLKANLQKAYKAYLVLQVHEDDERAEDTLDRCDDFFFDHEDQIEAILRGYASGIQL